MSGVERSLWDSTARACRRHPDYVVLILHLSRLTAPAPRAYHLRIARVLLEDTAARYDGQVFTMRNNDLVLLARSGRIAGELPDEARCALVHAPELLAETFLKLFSADLTAKTRLISLMSPAADAMSLPDYLAQCATTPALEACLQQQHDPVLSLTALQSMIDRVPLSELLAVRTGMRLEPERNRSLAERLRPAFRAIQVSFSALNLGALVSQATSDPFLHRHLAAGLDGRLMALLSDDIARCGRLTRVAVEGCLPLHVELGVPAVLSPDFALLAQRATAIGLRLGVVVSLLHASIDLERFDQARQIVARTGGELVLSQFEPRQMAFVNPARLRPSLIRLGWSACLLGQDLAKGAFKGGRSGQPCLDPTRIILEGADSHSALAWGQARGITLYEGPFLDQIQAALRMTACRHAACCSLGQCCDRARAAGDWGRTGCRDVTMLDAGYPAANGSKRAA